MAFVTNKASNNREELPKFALKGKNPTISGAKAISSKCIVFTLNVDGASFYGLRVVDGKNGCFVSMPQRQGRDNKYYDLYRLYLVPTEEQAVIDVVTHNYVGKDEVADYKTRVKVEV